MNLRHSPLATALLLAITAPALAAPTGEAPADAAMQAKELDTVEVHGERVQKASSPKYTEALVDTPQTITVVTSEVMAQQNLLGLRDVLSTLPGITFGAGEGGGGYGDSINLRGFNATTDITVDGVRDSAQYTRTDNFNLESIELINGANSAMSGAGSVGGNINLVSKSAREGDFSTMTLGAGTESFGRATVDSNHDFGDGQALRVNAMVHRNDVADRDVEEYKRWGIAPSFAIGLGSDTRFTLSYLHQHDENIPEYGLPYFAAYGGLLPGISRDTYFGYRNMDKQEIDVDVLTGVFEHDLSDTTSLRSLARYQKVDQYVLVNPTQGTWCLDNGINPANGLACGAPGTYQPSGPRGTTRDTTNGLALSQTDLTTRFNTGSVEHALVAGVSFMHETYELDNGNSQRNADGTAPVYPVMDIHDPDNVYRGPINYVRAGRTDGTLDNQALYVFDTLKFNPQWELALGARYEHNEGDTRTINFSTGAIGNFENEDDLFSYRAGLLFKPAENGSVYLSYANSKTPSKASVNGACTAQTCEVDPETAVNIELGTKWNLLEDRLAVTAGLFRNERQNYKVADPNNPDNPSGTQQLDGKARVDGIALGVAGNLTRAWSIFANYTYLDSEVLQSVSDRVLEDTGIDAQAGHPLPNTPEHSASAWTTYALQGWTFGYGVTYQGDFYTASAANAPRVKSYTMHRAMAGYQFNARFGLQLNIDNLFDKQYFTRVRNNGWATPGAARSAVLTATFKF
ncbi:TonB-dependent receptor [Pseudoxanthomonas sp. Root65]|uniref:TonB-dependent receptor n=1 Tax=Pseudoxanthomonas sp. Root65 TaxID=1736576 RepID=UPI0006FC40B2|nr:TonB-dependent siderophore receptor [Pseudoxanthomonas sp. Root65]KRA53386.1 TonB-dependent receptor [Pseudoxanthomonas sp. Root65]